MIAAISPPMPPVRLASCSTIALLGFGDRRQDRVAIERRERPQIDDLGLDPFLRQRLGGVERDVHHRAEGDDGHVAAGAATIALPIGTM